MARKVSTNPGDLSLSKSIDRRLKFYGIAAAAASVGLLALAEPAQSEIVITNKTIPIPRCDGLHTCPVKVDLNHDGIADFSSHGRILRIRAKHQCANRDRAVNWRRGDRRRL